MKINENLVLFSKAKRTSNYTIGRFNLSKDLEIGGTYTLSFEGEVIPEDKFGIWLGGGWVPIGNNITPKKKDGRFFVTFKVPDWTSRRYSHVPKDKIIPNGLNIYIWPQTEGYFISMEKTKLEKGTEMTPYVPNVADVKNNSLYPTKVGGGYLGGNTSHLGGVVCVS